MSEPQESQTIIDGQLRELSASEYLSPDTALEIASEITARAQSVVTQMEHDGRMVDVAELYDRIARAWKWAAARQTEEQHQYCQSLADYWAERAAASRRRAANVMESRRHEFTPMPVRDISATNRAAEKPITGPLRPPGTRPETPPKFQKEVGHTDGKQQSGGDQSRFRK